MRCKANGNYEDFQMIGNYTYCMNTTSGEILAKPVLRSNQDKLPCSEYGKKQLSTQLIYSKLLVDHKGDYTQETDCIKRYKSTLKEIEKKKDKGYMVVGYDVPSCNIDGSYKPVQCLNSQLSHINDLKENVFFNSYNSYLYYFLVVIVLTKRGRNTEDIKSIGIASDMLLTRPAVR